MEEQRVEPPSTVGIVDYPKSTYSKEFIKELPPSRRTRESSRIGAQRRATQDSTLAVVNKAHLTANLPTDI